MIFQQVLKEQENAEEIIAESSKKQKGKKEKKEKF